jgi:hypothetical protein
LMEGVIDRQKATTKLTSRVFPVRFSLKFFGYLLFITNVSLFPVSPLSITESIQQTQRKDIKHVDFF